MEINLKKLSEQEIQSTTGSKKMRLSENASSMVFQLFTKNVYSNPKGTVVREITSNCFDSHVEAGVNAPVIIRKSFDKEANTTYLSFIDFGVGMSPERVYEIYGVYFESTKRCDNTQIGGFGIGGKTPLAYKRSTGPGEEEYDNSFYVITSFNGTKYYYCMYEGADSPIISLLHEEPTTDRNGTEVRVPILDKDLSDFKKEMVRQLYYFENIIFEGFDDQLSSLDETLNNSYQIVRGKSFLYRGDDYSSNVHVCLGRVAYPLDYNVLGVSASDYHMPVAIRLEVGEINVTVSREALDYSESTIKTLKKKLEAVRNEILEIFSKQFDNVQTLEDYFKVKNNFGMVSMPNGGSFKVSDMIKFKDVSFQNFKYGFMKMPDDQQLFRLFFDTKLYGKKESQRRRYRWNSNNNREDGIFEGGYDELLKANNIYHYEGQFERKIIKQAYLKSLHTRYYMISKVQRFNKIEICDAFNVQSALYTVDVQGGEQPTQYCQSLIDLQNEYFEIVKANSNNYVDISVPETFVLTRKNVLTPEMRNTFINVHFADSYGRYRVKLDQLFALKCPIYYGTLEQEAELNQAARMFKALFNQDYVIRSYSEYNNTFTNQKKAICFMMVAKGNVRYMEYCKNAIPINKFFWNVLHRKSTAVVEYFQTRKFTDNFNSLNQLYKSPEFKILSPVWAKRIQSVAKFVRNAESGNKHEWYRHESELSHYFPINNITLTKEQQQYVKTIEEVREMEVLNANTLRHIDLPYNLSGAPESLWDILKKVLVY